MSCPDKQAKLMDWVLGELSPAEVGEIQLHVEQCAGCAHSLAGLRDVHQALMKQLTDREMPAHLVFLPEKPRELHTGFLASLWRTAALAAVAAGVFLVVVLGGYARWGRQPSFLPLTEKASFTRTEVEALVAHAVRLQMAQQKHEFEAVNEKLAADMRQEQGRGFSSLATQLQYLQSAQSVVWKQTQEQTALVELIARNSMGAETAQPSRP